MTHLELEDLVKRHDGVAVIDHVSLEVLPGELTYVLGPPGAGKTTLARLVAGLERLDGGAIRLDGQDVTLEGPGLRRIGLVGLGESLWPHLSVEENVAFALRMRGHSRRDRRSRVAEILSALRVEALGDRRPSELSPAQTRRVALARALAVQPDVLLLDEPLAGLTGASRQELQKELVRLHLERETTVLVFTADPAEALSAADVVDVLDLGRVVQRGSPRELYERPVDAIVAQLVGPANLIQGVLESQSPRGEAVVRTPLGRLVARAPEVAWPADSSLTVLVRPEAVTITDVAVQSANHFPAVVEREEFLGEIRQVHLRGPGDWPVLARMCGMRAVVQVGETVTVGIRPESVIVLPGRKAGGQSSQASGLQRGEP